MGWDKLGPALAGLREDLRVVDGLRVPAKLTSSNPHLNPRVRSAGFFSADVGRLLTGWDTISNTIDYYLADELRQMRARSRRMVRMNPYGKRFISMMKSNVVGPNGVTVQAHSVRRKSDGTFELDTAANEAIEAAQRDWAERHCDYLGRSTWVDLQNMAISCAGQDGEYLFRKHYGTAGGKYGFQLEAIDPELLDTSINRSTKSGEIRLGVEYNQVGRVVRYHFRKPSRNSYMAGYESGEQYTIDARHIIHGYIQEWPDQSRGIPWMHASLEGAKHLEKYDEAAIVNARGSASTMAVIHGPGSDRYEGEEEGEGAYAGATLEQYEAGTVKDIGDRNITQLDPNYPHQMYADFVKARLRSIASGLGISYHSLSNDLEGVNYSSIRAGVLEDREIFKGLQNWFIRGLCRPVHEEWLANAMLMGAIQIGRRRLSRPVDEYLPAHYQGRRWTWVDPLKDGAANQMAIKERLKSRSQLMREQGDDPDTTWREIARDEQMMARLGIQPVDAAQMQVTEDDDDD